MWFARDNSTDTALRYTLPFSLSLPGYERFYSFPIDVNGDSLPDLVVSGSGRVFGGGQCRVAVFLNQGSAGFPIFDWPEKKNPFNPVKFVSIPVAASDNSDYNSDSSSQPLNYGCPAGGAPAFVAHDFDKVRKLLSLAAATSSANPVG